MTSWIDVKFRSWAWFGSGEWFTWIPSYFSKTISPTPKKIELASIYILNCYTVIICSFKIKPNSLEDKNGDSKWRPIFEHLACCGQFRTLCILNKHYFELGPLLTSVNLRPSQFLYGDSRWTYFFYHEEDQMIMRTRWLCTLQIFSWEECMVTYSLPQFRVQDGLVIFIKKCMFTWSTPLMVTSDVMYHFSY